MQKTGPKLGSHTSTSGGLYRAVEIAAEVGADCVQIFTGNPNRWAIPGTGTALQDADVRRFREALAEHGISDPVSHASYLINFASPDSALREKSVSAMCVELERAEQLQLGGVVVHPGAFTKSSEAEGMRAITLSLKETLQQTGGMRTRILLENTAGQGSCLGWDLSQLQAMLDGVGGDPRVGVCIDTCHAFAAGYDLASETGFRDFIDQLERCVGIGRVAAIHLNDSKKELGSRVDRHEHIGEGAIGLEAFRRLLNHPRLAQIPMYLETEKGERDGVALDTINLGVLRGLIGHPEKSQKG